MRDMTDSTYIIEVYGYPLTQIQAPSPEDAVVKWAYDFRQGSGFLARVVGHGHFRTERKTVFTVSRAEEFDTNDRKNI